MPAIVITGASTGIGAATALHLASLGHVVFAGVRKVADGERLVAQAPDLAAVGPGSGRIEPLLIDVADHESVVAAEKAVAASLGAMRLIGLVNNAGITERGPIEYLPLETWRRIFDVNVFGAVDVTRTFLPLLRRGEGRVVFVGSLIDRLAMPLLAPYAASKSALAAVAGSLRAELDPWGIGVSLVEPGPVRSAIWDKVLRDLDHLDADAPPDLAVRYGARLDKARQDDARSAETGGSPEAVAAVIAKALHDRRPKARYPVGLQGRVFARFAQFLPARAADALLRNV